MRTLTVAVGNLATSPVMSLDIEDLTRFDGNEGRNVRAAIDES